MSERFSLATGVVIERVGDDLVALIPEAKVVTLTGQAADVVGRVMAGEDVEPSNEAVVALVDAGVLTAPAGLTRRKVMQLGAVATGVGVATLALPSVAAAASIDVSFSIWYWANRYVTDQENAPEFRAGYPDPAWARVFVVSLSSDFVLPAGVPSSLRVAGEEFSYIPVGDDQGPASAGSLGFLQFFNDISTDSTTPKTEPLTGNLTGSYTWAGVTYEVTFEQIEDQ